MAHELREIKGGVERTTLRADLTAGALTVPLTDGTGWPTGGANGDFIVGFDMGGDDEAYARCSSRSGNDCTVIALGRGYDNSADMLHPAGTTVDVVVSMTDYEEANYAVSQTVGKVTTAEDLLVASAANAFKRLAKGPDDELLTVVSGVLGYRKLTAASIATSLSKGQIVADRTARDALTGYEGLVVYVTADNLFYVYQGSTWEPVGGQVLGYAQVTADQGSITTEVDLTNLSVTIASGVLGGNSRITIEGKADYIPGVADTGFQLRVKEGTTVLNSAYGVGPVGTERNTVIAEARLTPTAAAHTYKLSGGRHTGTGTITMKASATEPAFIVIESAGLV